MTICWSKRWFAVKRKAGEIDEVGLINVDSGYLVEECRDPEQLRKAGKMTFEAP
jgi:hypothetical protein